MKTNLPEELQENIPKTTWGRVLAATPVVMTVVATLLAGLASSEMTRAQYDRSLATQQQSKAGDQWSFFQAKRLRGVMQQGTLDGLEFTGTSAPRHGAALLESLSTAATAAKISPATLEALAGDQAPAPAKPASLDPKVEAAIAAVAAQKTDPEIDALVSAVSDSSLDSAIATAKLVVTRYDETVQPLVREIDTLHRAVSDQKAAVGGASNNADGATTPSIGGSANTPTLRDFAAARLRFNIRRYESEARLNQTLANLYELQVRKSNMSAQRHYVRSQRFFFGMLAAQLSVIMSTFATAVRMRNTLWTLAAVAGIFAVALAAYVYLWV